MARQYMGVTAPVLIGGDAEAEDQAARCSQDRRGGGAGLDDLPSSMRRRRAFRDHLLQRLERVQANAPCTNLRYQGVWWLHNRDLVFQHPFSPTGAALFQATINRGAGMSGSHTHCVHIGAGTCGQAF